MPEPDPGQSASPVWVIETCPACGGLLSGAIATHIGDCPNRFRAWVPKTVEVVPRSELAESERHRIRTAGPDLVTLPDVDTLEEDDGLPEDLFLPTVGYCSKCGEAREDDYTCRDGGTTIIPGQVWERPHGAGRVRIQGFSKTDRGWVKVREIGGPRERWSIPPAAFRNGSMVRVDA